MSIYRDNFKAYCLRKLGAPVTEINVSPDQIDDRVDDAVQMFTEHHFRGVEKVFLKHVLTADEIVAKEIEVPDYIFSVLRVVNTGSTFNHDGLFDPIYQWHLNAIYDFQSYDLIEYDIAKQQLGLFKRFFRKEFFVRYNLYKNLIQFDNDWSELYEGQILLIEAYRALDPEEYWEIYNDRWLKAYATALIKYQWGSNMGKYDNVQLPGGVTMNGTQIKDEAKEEIAELKEEMKDEHMEPVDFFIG